MAYIGDTLLVIISSANYFFDSRPQQNGVLKLCRVAALDIAKWRVRINDTNIAQVLQCKQIPCLQKKETNHFSCETKPRFPPAAITLRCDWPVILCASNVIVQSRYLGLYSGIGHHENRSNVLFASLKGAEVSSFLSFFFLIINNKQDLPAPSDPTIFGRMQEYQSSR